jgi:hypothetical protein
MRAALLYLHQQFLYRTGVVSFDDLFSACGIITVGLMLPGDQRLDLPIDLLFRGGKLILCLRDRFLMLFPCRPGHALRISLDVIFVQGLGIVFIQLELHYRRWLGHGLCRMRWRVGWR